MYVFFFFKQKTAYEMRISDWSSDVCSSDLAQPATPGRRPGAAVQAGAKGPWRQHPAPARRPAAPAGHPRTAVAGPHVAGQRPGAGAGALPRAEVAADHGLNAPHRRRRAKAPDRPEEHTSELPSLMRIS